MENTASLVRKLSPELLSVIGCGVAIATLMMVIAGWQREDIWALNDRIEKLDIKLSDRFERLDAKLSGQIEKLEAKLGREVARLDARIDTVQEDLGDAPVVSAPRR